MGVCGLDLHTSTPDFREGGWGTGQGGILGIRFGEITWRLKYEVTNPWFWADVARKSAMWI